MEVDDGGMVKCRPSSRRIESDETWFYDHGLTGMDMYTFEDDKLTYFSIDA